MEEVRLGKKSVDEEVQRIEFITLTGGKIYKKYRIYEKKIA